MFLTMKVKFILISYQWVCLLNQQPKILLSLLIQLELNVCSTFSSCNKLLFISFALHLISFRSCLRHFSDVAISQKHVLLSNLIVFIGSKENFHRKY